MLNIWLLSGDTILAKSYSCNLAPTITLIVHTLVQIAESVCEPERSAQQRGQPEGEAGVQADDQYALTQLLRLLIRR